MSRNGHTFKSWPQLAEELAHALRVGSAILDGEICCLDPDGRSNFNRLLFRRDWPHFYAFDVLQINGRDVGRLPLTERKQRLRDIMPVVESRVLLLDSLPARGCDLFRAACERDIEGIVAKWVHGTYRTDGRSTSWLKIKHREYSQIRDRHELFERHQSRTVRSRVVTRPDLVLS